MLDNYGLYWNGGDLRRLVKLYHDGKTMVDIGKELGRTPSACANRLRMFNTYELFAKGKDEENLVQYKKRISK